MIWLETIAECINLAMAEQGKSQRDIARLSGLVDQTVSSVLAGKAGTRADSFDAVVQALGLRIVATCVPATPTWEADYEDAAVELRRRTMSEPEDMGNLKAAEELLDLCRTLIKRELAAEAVQALYKWRAGLDPTGQHGGGGKLGNAGPL